MKHKGHYAGPVICYRATTGTLPTFIALGHRHLEKASPPPLSELGHEHGLITYRMPADLIRMVLPAATIDEIESVDLVYRKG